MFVFGVLLIGGIITLFIRLQRGFIGIILSGIAFLVLIFWIKEMKGFFSEEKYLLGKSTNSENESEESWLYDLFEENNEKILIAKVPGPKKAIKVKSLNNRLEILGGQKFFKVLKMPKKISINRIEYKNGVLQVRFKEDSKILSRS
jgi:HSP20 family molecular chaperone IbpA